MGTLGFMAPFFLEKYKEYLTTTFKGDIPCILRNRLCFNIGNLEDLNKLSSVTNGKVECSENMVKLIIYSITYDM